MLVKVCGITRQADLDEAGRLGVNALGLNFFQKSPRFISKLLANSLLSKWPQGVVSVGLLVKPTESTVLELVLDVPRLHWLQFHALESIPTWPVPRPWVASFAPKCPADLADILLWLNRAASCQTPPSAVLIDGHAPGMEGGTGVTAPWELLRSFHPPIPWILAGGIQPENVSQALQFLRPDAIDVASGVEEAPGIKSAKKNGSPNGPSPKKFALKTPKKSQASLGEVCQSFYANQMSKASTEVRSASSMIKR